MKDSKDNYVIYEADGDFYGTNEDNYHARIQNANEIQDFRRRDGFTSIDQVKQYVEKYFHVPGKIIVIRDSIKDNSPSVWVGAGDKVIEKYIDRDGSEAWIRLAPNGRYHILFESGTAGPFSSLEEARANLKRLRPSLKLRDSLYTVRYATKGVTHIKEVRAKNVVDAMKRVKDEKVDLIFKHADDMREFQKKVGGDAYYNSKYQKWAIEIDSSRLDEKAKKLYRQLTDAMKRVKDSTASEIYQEIKKAYPQVHIAINTVNGFTRFRFSNYPGENNSPSGGQGLEFERWYKFISYLGKKYKSNAYTYANGAVIEEK